MKLLNIVILLCLFFFQSEAQYTRICYSSSTTGILTTTTNMGATLCVVGIPAFDNGGTLSVSDNQGNAWLLADSGGTAGGVNEAIFYTYYKGSIGTPIQTSATYTATVTATGTNFLSCYLSCVSGGIVSSNPLVAHSHATGMTAANNVGGTNQAGACAGLNNYFGVALMNCFTGVSAPALSINSGYNLFASNTYLASSYFCGGMATATVTGITNPAWQVPGVTGNGVAGCALFSSRYTNPGEPSSLIRNFNQSRK